MDRNSTVVIHRNPYRNNQIVYADYFYKGFKAMGFDNVRITNEREANADLHVCIGPHYAMRGCLGKPTLYADRCLWGDDMQSVTLGWLKKGEGMFYPSCADGNRLKPDIIPWKTGDIKNVLVLLDYGPYPNTYLLAKEIYQTVNLRPHPATGKTLKPLLEELEGVDLAIGYRTSALVTAALQGIPVISLDNRSAVYDIAGHDLAEIKRPDRTQWLNNMSYAQWEGTEIESGEALKYVLDYQTDKRAGNS